MVQSTNGRNLNEVVYKTCPRCKISKPATTPFFYPNRARSDNLSVYCRPCHANLTKLNNREYRAKNKEAINERSTVIRKEKKAEAVKYLGGKCQCCGFNKCLSALQFHHRDPAEKEGDFGKIKFMSPEKRKEELDKCDLLCANCHHAFHAGDVIHDENGYTWKVDHPNYASMAESVDAPDLKSVDL